MPADYQNLQGPFNTYRFPDDRSSPEEVLSYRNRVFSKYAVYRRRTEARMAVAMQYMIDNQWLDLMASTYPDPAFGYRLKLLQTDQDMIPRPVTNILAPNIEVELATYNKRKFMPKAVAATNMPWDMEAARKATDVLKYRAEVESWSVVRQRFGLFLVGTGTGVMRSWWDETYLETDRVPSPLAVRCMACQQLYQQPTVAASARMQIRFNSDSLQPVPGRPDQLQMYRCPQCGSLEPLQPTPITQQEMEYNDFMGRPMGVVLPKGEPAMEALDPFSAYPENGGVAVSYDNFRVFGSATPRSLDWILDRHPQFDGQLKPDSQQELLRRNPLLGEFSAYGWYGGVVDSNVFNNHAVYYEMWAMPTRRMPAGGLIRVANNLILERGPLIWQYTDENGVQHKVPRVMYSAGVWSERPGEFFGHGMIDRGKSLQNRLNGRDAQIIDINERMANPHVMAATDQNLTGPEWFEGPYSGKLMLYERSPLAPDDKPQIFGGVSPPQGLWQERNAVKDDVRLILGPAEIEIGASPKNVTTTSGLQLQSEQAESRRSPREDTVDYASKRLWKHKLQMEQCFRVDDSEYEVQDPTSKKWRTEVYNRYKLQGKLRLEIEKTAFVSKSIYDREAAREAQADGLYQVNKPQDRKALLDMRGLPTDVNRDENNQVDRANEKWACFLRDGQVPVIDQTLENPAIHWDVLSGWLLSEDGKRFAELANWPALLPLLTDWETLLQQRIQLDAACRQVYGQWSTEEQAVEAYKQKTAEYQQALPVYQQQMQGYEQAVQAAMAAGQQPPPVPMQPVEPPVPTLLPRPLDKKVLTVWRELFELSGLPRGQQGGVQLPPSQELRTDLAQFQIVVENYLRFRAVVEAYRLMTKGIGLSAPAATATPIGVTPNPPNPPNPQNTSTPGTSQALSNSGQAVAQAGTVAGGPQ